MDNNKGQTLFLSVIGVATLLVAIIGATFAWFSVNVQGNEDASSIVVTTAVLGGVVFTDGDEINLDNIRPEDDLSTNEATKTFTVSNTVADISTKLDYKVSLEITTNNLSAAANQSQGASGVTGDWFNHTLTGAKTTDQTSPKLAGCVSAVVNMAKTAVPTATADLGNTGTICGLATHTYTYNIHLEDSNANQNAAQGKTFRGRIQVNLVNQP